MSNIRASPKVLVACEESQAVTIAFRSVGIAAFSCDLKPCTGGFPEWHIQDDVLKLLDYSWDAIIAFPPCTYLANSGSCRLYLSDGSYNFERESKALAGREFFMRFYNSSCSRVAIENPVPAARWNLPPYTQIIQPYEFGHNFSKRTCLWLKGLPPLMATCLCYDYVSWVFNCPSSDLAAQRAKTFPGVAEAMANQWKGVICGEW